MPWASPASGLASVVFKSVTFTIANTGTSGGANAPTLTFQPDSSFVINVNVKGANTLWDAVKMSMVWSLPDGTFIHQEDFYVLGGNTVNHNFSLTGPCWAPNLRITFVGGYASASPSISYVVYQFPGFGLAGTVAKSHYASGAGVPDYPGAVVNPLFVNTHAKFIICGGSVASGANFFTILPLWNQAYTLSGFTNSNTTDGNSLISAVAQFNFGQANTFANVANRGSSVKGTLQASGGLPNVQCAQILNNTNAAAQTMNASLTLLDLVGTSMVNNG